MLVSLIGFMCSGKSTVGPLLADSLGCPFFDLDALVEKKAGCSIPDIFASGGEASFRKLEQKTLEETLKKYSGSTAVLALGGGTVTIPGATSLLQDKTVCIYLKASLETLQGRIEGQSAHRPLACADLAALLSAREPLYQQAAHVVINTESLTPEQITDEIIISCL